MWVKAQADNFHFVTFKSVITLSSISVPNLCFSIKWACDNFVSKNIWTENLPKRIIESHTIYHVIVFIQTQQLCTRIGIPNFAGSVVAASNEFIATLVEGTVSEWQQMGAQHFEQAKLLLLIF